MSDYAYDATAQELYLSAGTPRSRLNTLEGAVANKANKVDLTNISITGSTNNTGATIASGTFFYKDGDLVQAKVDIANGATLTLNTNYEVVTAGGLNKLNALLTEKADESDLTTLSTSLNWEDITSKCSWSSYANASYRKVRYNKKLKLVYVTAYVNSGIGNQSAIVTLPSTINTIAYEQYVSARYSLSQSMTIDIVAASGTRTIKSSHSVGSATSVPYVFSGFVMLN